MRKSFSSLQQDVQIQVSLLQKRRKSFSIETRHFFQDEEESLSSPKLIIRKIKQAKNEILNAKTIGEAASRGLVEGAIGELLSGLMNEDLPSDVTTDTAHLAVKSVTIDFLGDTLSTLKTNLAPYLLLMYREVECVKVDSSFDFHMWNNEVNDCSSNTFPALQDINTVKVVARYILWPVFSRCIAHTAPAMAVHMGVDELRQMF
jgi:hypothetical protein